MAKHGFDEAKLHRNLDRLLGGWVERGELPCVQALVVRHGETAYSKAFGWADLEAKRPLAEDAIFRIFSMTKVFTSVAAMMLHEEGRFKMHDPLSRYIPAFGHTKVAICGAAGRVTYEVPRREIIVRDLFTMASGMPYPGIDTPSEREMHAIFEQMAVDREAGKPWNGLRFAQACAERVPLNFHPGEHWWYGLSLDLLGVLVEVLSGQTLGAFMRERIFAPLGMHDTGFCVPPEKRDRFVRMYKSDDKGGYVPDTDNFYERDFYGENAMESGGGGLTSTLRDVGIFAQMLLGEGAWAGKRLLSRKSVALMRTNHLSEQQLKDYVWDTQRGYGYGLGVRVMMHPEIAGYGSVGEFAWDGLAGTWFAVDPAEQMIAVFLMQINPGGHYERVPYFAQTIYGAMED